MKYYSEEHEWVEVEEAVATVGITTFAAEELGDITFVDLPDVGTHVKQGDVLCVVESVKAASDVFAPISGVVTEVNGDLDGDPGRLNASAEGDGWICRLQETDPQELKGLMTAAQYQAYVAKDKK